MRGIPRLVAHLVTQEISLTMHSGLQTKNIVWHWHTDQMQFVSLEPPVRNDVVGVEGVGTGVVCVVQGYYEGYLKGGHTTNKIYIYIYICVCVYIYT